MSNARATIDRSAAAIGLVTVVAANFLYLAGLPLILDPMMSMEPFYIHMAQLPPSGILSQDPAWGPLYAMWLKPFIAALGDPVAVYTANLYALSFGISVVIYLYLLLLTRRAAAGVGAALFFMISDFNVPLSNKVSEFALMVVLAGLTMSELLATGPRRMTVVAVGVLLASFARPELYPAAICLFLAALWLAYRGLGKSGSRILVWPAAGVAGVLLSALWSATPVFGSSDRSGRLFMAFREHFGWNWARWHNEWRDLFSVWEEEFGGAQTLLQAVRNNPGAVLHHVTDNLLGTVRFIAASAFDHYPVLVPATSPDLVKAESLLLSAAVFGSLIVVFGRRGWRDQMFDRYGHALFPYLIMATFSLVSATAIFPLAHYLVIPGVLLMLAGTLAATLIIPERPVSSWQQRVLAGLVCLMVVPRPFVLPTAYVVPGSSFKGRLVVERPVVDTIAFIRSLRLTAPVQVLTLTDGIGEMLGAGFQEVKIWQKGTQSLEAYMRENDVGMIVSLQPERDSFLFSDPYWTVVHNTPEAAGFTRLSVPNHEAVGVYVRTDLMPRHGDSTSTPNSSTEEPHNV